MKILHIALLFLIIVAVPLSGCAVTQSAIHSAGKIPPFCEIEAKQENAIVLWGTAWRMNQKEMQLREQKASQAISQFFGTRSCYAKTTVLRNISGHDPVSLSDIEAIEFVSALPDHYHKIILLRIEELGPLLIFYLSPILWEGGSEAVFRVRILDVNSRSLESDVTMHRRDTGAFVLRGTKHLEDDLEAALGQVFFGTIK